MFCFPEFLSFVACNPVLSFNSCWKSLCASSGRYIRQAEQSPPPSLAPLVEEQFQIHLMRDCSL
eukprot:2911232-Amphidinium_carterae.1